MIKIISAIYESGNNKIDMTGTAVDLFNKGNGFFCVGSAFGDPFPMQKKSLRIKYQAYGKEYEDVVSEWDIFVPRPLRVEGIPGGKEGFEIEWAKYGAEQFIDFTEEAKKYYTDPFTYCSIFDYKTDPKTKTFIWGDPHPGILKHYLVRFSYHGRTYINDMKEPDARQKLLSPMFSVIIPTWNRAAFLNRCIDSVLNQDFDPSLVEIIVVDDGSTDETPKIMSEICMKHPQVLYLRIHHTGCCGLARNQGFLVSSGAYVSYLDSDDKFKPDHLSTVFERFQKSNALMLRVWNDFCTLKLMDNGEIQEHFEEDFNHKLFKKYAVYPSCVSHRRELLSAMGRTVPFIAREGEDVHFFKMSRDTEIALGIPEEVIEKKTMTYGLIVGGNNLSYETPAIAKEYRDRK